MNLATQPDIVCPVDFGPITFMLIVKPDQWTSISKPMKCSIPVWPDWSGKVKWAGSCLVLGRVLQNGQENSTYWGLCLCYCRATGREGGGRWVRRECRKRGERRVRRNGDKLLKKKGILWKLGTIWLMGSKTERNKSVISAKREQTESASASLGL